MSLVKKQYDKYIWELKWRPDSLAKIIMPAKARAMFESIVESGDVPNMLFSGSAGCGKTTTAFVLADVMDLSAMYMNCSIDTGLDAIRNKLTAFASSVSLSGKKKVFIGDEFDRLSPQAMDSLKGLIESMSRNCKFIFTSNHKGKIIAPIISRLQEVDFVFKKADVILMKKHMFRSCLEICTKEDVDFDKKAVGKIVNTEFPDMRKIINKLQMLSLQGPITMESVSTPTTDLESYFQMLRDKDWLGVRQYIVDLPIDFNDFYSVLYNSIERYVREDFTSEAVLQIAKYQYEAAFAADKQIPLAALAIEQMNLEFKKDF